MEAIILCLRPQNTLAGCNAGKLFFDINKEHVERQRFSVKKVKPEMVIKCFAEVFSGG